MKPRAGALFAQSPARGYACPVEWERVSDPSVEYVEQSTCGGWRIRFYGRHIGYVLTRLDGGGEGWVACKGTLGRAREAAAIDRAKRAA
jgi:hypothetical protein